MDETPTLETAGSDGNSEESTDSVAAEVAQPKEGDPHKRDNQHYISKAHLDKFIHPSSEQKVLYPYTKGCGPQPAKGTKCLASADHFYRQIDAGELTNKLDEARKQIETQLFASGKRTSGPLAKCIFDDSYTPIDADKIMLVWAAAFLRCGSPVQIHNCAMSGVMASQMWSFNQLNTDRAKTSYTEKYGDNAEKMIEEDRKKLWEGKIVADVGEENWKQLGFESIGHERTYLDQLMKMGLTICSSHPKSFFITSDNPVILVSSLQPNNPGLIVPDVRVWFPISYRKGLLWSWAHRGINKTAFGHSETRMWNRQMIKWCYREVYSPSPEDWLRDAVKEIEFDPRLGHYGSLKEMAESHSLPALDANNKEVGEIIDSAAALRAGKKHDVLKLKPMYQPRGSRPKA